MKSFYVGIKGVIVKDNKVLLLRANAANGRRDIWEIPGGRIDADENIEETLQRELKEELPNIKNIKIHGILDAYRLQWDIDGDKSLVLIFFKVTADFDGNAQISDEHVDIKWLAKDEALKLAAENCQTAIIKAFEHTN